MIFAIGVMLITSLLVFAAFTQTTNDIHLSYRDTLQKKAFLAASTGVQEYEHKLQVNSDYWEKSCEGPQGTVSGETSESYVTSLLPANTTTTNKSKLCSPASPFETMIEKEGPTANTFSVKSVGSAGGVKRTLIATFKVSGFLDFAYFTQYEDEDPYLTGRPASECERYYEEAGKSRRSERCVYITFTKEDSVKGPMHTDDSALVECSKEVAFGRSGQDDAVEIDRGTYSSGGSEAKGPASSPCSGTGPTYNTFSKTFSEGAELLPPESDSSVRAYVEPGYEFTGRTEVTLNGKTMTVTNANFHADEPTSVPLPANGLVFVRTGSGGCNYEYLNTSGHSDSSQTDGEEAECGSVWVHGTYSESLTLAAETDVVINGELVPTGVSAGNAPTGTATLGLMATRFVRIYHPCSFRGNETGSLTNPWIYAAILSTSHSFVVDNYDCGNQLGHLNVYGAIAQKFRGVVGQVGGSGYLKDYLYDERLATDEPPYFLAPLDAGWMIERETAESAG
ncbi:MAG: hypothetical protein ACRDJX_07635 [Solirubrobacteraceae bacterium]